MQRIPSLQHCKVHHYVHTHSIFDFQNGWKQPKHNLQLEFKEAFSDLYAFLQRPVNKDTHTRTHTNIQHAQGHTSEDTNMRICAHRRTQVVKNIKFIYSIVICNNLWHSVFTALRSKFSKTYANGMFKYTMAGFFIPLTFSLPWS